MATLGLLLGHSTVVAAVPPAAFDRRSIGRTLLEGQRRGALELVQERVARLGVSLEDLRLWCRLRRELGAPSRPGQLAKAIPALPAWRAALSLVEALSVPEEALRGRRLTQLARAQSGDPLTAVAAARWALERGELEEARSLLAPLSPPPRSRVAAEVAAARAALCLAEFDPARALSLCEGGLGTDSPCPFRRAVQVEALARSGREARAVEILTEALYDAPCSLDLIEVGVDLRCSRREFDSARALAERARTIWPGEAVARELPLRVLLAREGGAAICAAIARGAGDDLPARRRLRLLLEGAWLQRDRESLRQAVEESDGLAPDERDAPWRIARWRCRLAFLEGDLPAFEEAYPATRSDSELVRYLHVLRAADRRQHRGTLFSLALGAFLVILLWLIATAVVRSRRDEGGRVT